MTIDEERKRLPAYVSHKTFYNLMNQFKQHLPNNFNRRYWGVMFSGSSGYQLTSALQFLNLIDENNRPTSRLKSLVISTEEQRAVLLRNIANEAYAFVLKGSNDPQNATYKELEGVFRNTYKVKIDVCRKCVKFLIEFSKHAGIPLAARIKQKRQKPRTSHGIKNINKNHKLRGDVHIDASIPPGKYLLEKIASRNLSQKEFARRMGMPLNEIDEIIKGKKIITTQTALRLEEVMPAFPARFWLYLQSDFQLTKALIARRSMK